MATHNDPMSFFDPIWLPANNLTVEKWMTMTETSLTLAASPLPKSKDTVEDIQNKILSINEVVTSLTLAAEAGNALLAENSKLKQDVYALTLKNSQLVQHITREKHCSDLKIAEEKIEILERENEILLNRNATLVEMLTEMEHQLVKEKELRTNLMKCSKSKTGRKKKLFTFPRQKSNSLIKDCTLQDPKSNTNTGTQTYNCDTSFPLNYNVSLPLLLELAQLKTHQDQMELCVKALQEHKKVKIFKQRQRFH
ncbi:hypothetical protein J6590_099207 [Homalodisca vitripennis]|nr:hypothetical protein J6590_099207 [Homalodisca vitripennis]